MAVPQKPIIKRVLDTADDVGEFIAGPRPQNPVGGAYHDYTRWVCDSYANVPDWAKTAATVGGAPNMGLAMDIICGQYLGQNMPQATVPFTGGQCPGVMYRVVVGRRANIAPPSADIPYDVVGPVRGIRTATIVPSPGNDVLQGWLQHGQGQEVNLGGMFFKLNGQDNNPQWLIVSVTRLDGLPDNCGNPPAEPRPVPGVPTAPTSPPGGGQPPIWDEPGGGPIFRPGPIQTPYGPIEFPPIDPFDPGGGDDDDPFDDPPPPPPPPPGDQGEEGEEEEAEDDSPASACAPAGKVLVGLKFRIVQTPPYAREFAPGVYRAVAYIYMGGDDGLDQDYAGSMLRDGQFVFAEKENLTCWRVDANVGFKLIVTPFYREVES